MACTRRAHKPGVQKCLNCVFETMRARRYRTQFRSSSFVDRRLAMMMLDRQFIDISLRYRLYTMHTLQCLKSPLDHCSRPKHQNLFASSSIREQAQTSSPTPVQTRNLCLSSAGNVVSVLYGYTFGLLKISSLLILFLDLGLPYG